MSPGGAEFDVGGNAEFVESRDEPPRAFTGRGLDDSAGTGLPDEHERIARDLTAVMEANEALMRTLNMFKGVVSKTQAG